MYHCGWYESIGNSRGFLETGDFMERDNREVIPTHRGTVGKRLVHLLENLGDSNEGISITYCVRYESRP